MSVEHASAPAVAVEELRKSFKIPAHQIHTLKERAMHPFRRQEMRSADVLRDISFSVAEGEFFGIVGRNGSGKSTLLKCLAGIYGADAGRIRVKGRLSAFIELGVGFNMDLAARDNVMINATLLGLSPRDARRRCDEVIAFAELERHTELKLKNYSSGMLVRLAFAVMIQVDADVLLIDEVLAVGDAAFQQKCYDEFHRLRDEGRTVVLVTHDMGAVERFCDRAMLIEDGRIAHMGEPHEVGLEYLAVNFAPRDLAKDAEPTDSNGGAADTGDDAGADPADAADAAADLRHGSREAEVFNAWFENARGARTDVLPTGADCAFVLEARFATDVEHPLFGVVLQNAQRVTVFGASTNFTDTRPGTYRAGETVTVRIRFRNMLAPDRYDATPAVAFGGTGISWIDRRERFASVVVTGPRSTDAVLEIPYDISVDRKHGDSSERAMLA